MPAVLLANWVPVLSTAKYWQELSFAWLVPAIGIAAMM